MLAIKGDLVYTLKSITCRFVAGKSTAESKFRARMDEIEISIQADPNEKDPLTQLGNPVVGEVVQFGLYEISRTVSLGLFELPDDGLDSLVFIGAEQAFDIFGYKDLGVFLFYEISEVGVEVPAFAIDSPDVSRSLKNPGMENLQV